MQVDEVKNIMVDNIEKVLERGEKIELLVDKADGLKDRVRLLQINRAHFQTVWHIEQAGYTRDLTKPLTSCRHWVFLNVMMQ